MYRSIRRLIHKQVQKPSSRQKIQQEHRNTDCPDHLQPGKKALPDALLLSCSKVLRRII